MNKNKKKLMEKSMKSNIKKLAHKTFLEYGSCAQAVLIALKNSENIIDNNLIKSSHTFSGGMGQVGYGACGALTGGLLAIGAKFGRPLHNLENFDSSESNQKSKELIEWFKSEMEGFSCNDFQESIHDRTFDLWNPLEKQKVKTDNFRQNCAKLCGSVAEKCNILLNNS